MLNNKKQKLLETAKGLIGRPYKYGASTDNAPEVFDCSSLTQYLYKRLGIELPRSSILQAADPKGELVTPKGDFSNLEVGDLLFMRGSQGYYNDDLFGGNSPLIGHVAIYIGDSKVIHTRSSLGKVAEQNLGELTARPNYKISLVKRFI